MKERKSKQVPEDLQVPVTMKNSFRDASVGLHTSETVSRQEDTLHSQHRDTEPDQNLNPG